MSKTYNASCRVNRKILSALGSRICYRVTHLKGQKNARWIESNANEYDEDERGLLNPAGSSLINPMYKGSFDFRRRIR